MDWHEIKVEAFDEPETQAEHSSVVMAADVCIHGEALCVVGSALP